MVSGVNEMSLMNFFRSKNSQINELNSELENIREENRRFLEEIKELKKLLYHVELDYTAKILKK
jgi:peptidoglycan hydrolase CwlO-like protein